MRNLPSPDAARRALICVVVLLVHLAFAEQGAADEARVMEPVSPDSGQELGLEDAHGMGVDEPMSLADTDSQEDPEPPEPPASPGLQWGVSIGNFYDSNAALLGNGTALPPAFKRKGDYAFGIAGDFSYSHLITLDRRKRMGKSVTLGIGGAASQEWHPNLSEFDRGFFSGRLFANWESEISVPHQEGYDQGGVYFGVQYEHTTDLLDRDRFSLIDRVTPVMSIIWCRDPDNIRFDNEMDKTEFYYTYGRGQFRDFIRRRTLDRDGHYHRFGFRHTAFLKKAQDLWFVKDFYDGLDNDDKNLYYSHEWLKAYVGYEHISDHTAGTEFDRSADALTWGVHVPLPHRWSFDVDGEFLWSDHTERSIFAASPQGRADFSQHYRFAFTHLFEAERCGTDVLQATLRAGVDLTFQDSNISSRFNEDPYDFNRAVYGLQLELRWIPTRFSESAMDLLIPTKASGLTSNSGIQIGTTTQITGTLGSGTSSRSTGAASGMSMPSTLTTTMP